MKNASGLMSLYLCWEERVQFHELEKIINYEIPHFLQGAFRFPNRVVPVL
jgi:hypothetical protein